jgi:hypothetical protein
VHYSVCAGFLSHWQGVLMMASTDEWLYVHHSAHPVHTAWKAGGTCLFTGHSVLCIRHSWEYETDVSCSVASFVFFECAWIEDKDTDSCV